MKRFLLLFLCLPGCGLFAAATVLVDALPSGGAFYGLSPFGLPFRDAETADLKAAEAGMAKAVAGLVQATATTPISYICLLSAPGENPVEVFIPAAKTKLKLARKNTAVSVVFYTGGASAATPMVFSTGSPDDKQPHVSIKAQKIAVPAGVTTAGWIYFNLTRIQAEAIKAGKPEAFIKLEGTGAGTPVVIPGMKEPLMAFDDQATLSASWYIDAKAEAALRQQAQAKGAR